MKFNNLSKLCLVLLFGLICAQNEPITEKPTESPTTPTSTTAATPTESTSTAAPPVPTTPTVAPTTSTVAPTTAAPTTVAPTTTTVAPSTTTVGPSSTAKPVPNPDTGMWVYKDPASNETCVLVQLAIQLNLTYVTKDNQNKTVKYDVPKDAAAVSGSCDKAGQNILVEWGPKENASTFMLKFAMNETSKLVTVTEIVFEINGNEFSDSKDGQVLYLFNNEMLFTTPEAMSYYCTKAQTFNLTDSEQGNNIVGSVELTHTQIEAYHNKKNNNQFSTAKDCDSIDTPDIVPITVGCALAALVIIVLIAYLVGRRRALQRGYTSM